jgi:hypothetical protein
MRAWLLSGLALNLWLRVDIGARTLLVVGRVDKGGLGRPIRIGREG